MCFKFAFCLRYIHNAVEEIGDTEKGKYDGQEQKELSESIRGIMGDILSNNNITTGPGLRTRCTDLLAEFAGREDNDEIVLYKNDHENKCNNYSENISNYVVTSFKILKMIKLLVKLEFSKLQFKIIQYFLIYIFYSNFLCCL